MALKRHITFLGLFFTGIGSIIGSGWLFAPYYSAQLAGPYALYAWGAGAVIIILVALSFAEISTKHPIAGGIVRLIQFTHGNSISLIVGWLSWASLVLTPAIEVQASLQYCSHFFPQLILHGGDHVTLLGFIVAAALMGLFILINSIGIKLVTRINNIIGWWKILVPVIIAIALLCLNFHAQNFTATTQHPMPGFKDILMALSIGGIVFAYVGFRTIIELAEESSNPIKHIPWAVAGVIIVCAAIYLLLQVAFIGAISPQDIAHGWQNLHFAGDASPLVNIISVIGLVWMIILLYTDAIASPSGTSLVATAATARVTYAMAKAGYLPGFLAKTNQNGSPYVASLINYCVGLLFFLPFSGWQSMISFLVSTSVMAYALGPIVLMSMRKQKIHAEKHFKLPVAKFLCPIIFYLCTLILYWTGWNIIWKLDALVVIGIVFLTIFALVDDRHSGHYHVKHCLWLLGFLIGLSVLSYFGIFNGGHKQIGLLASFVILAAYSLIFYFIGVQSRLSEFLEV